ncbi:MULTISPECIES: hypothetical protein [unclassified Paraburkholderia]|uniref:hypothetical protein n=1 Tax=unclassified Paraburkholderia TaxID=2615204 RepID=UPI002AB7DA12|nr:MULTISPECIES: hypothetical protein [unclassified Paraburkholderia]
MPVQLGWHRTAEGKPASAATRFLPGAISSATKSTCGSYSGNGVSASPISRCVPSLPAKRPPCKLGQHFLLGKHLLCDVEQRIVHRKFELAWILPDYTSRALVIYAIYPSRGDTDAKVRPWAVILREQLPSTRMKDVSELHKFSRD